MVRIDQVGVAGVAIAHDGAGVSGQDSAGVDVGGAAPAGVHQTGTGCLLLRRGAGQQPLVRCPHVVVV